MDNALRDTPAINSVLRLVSRSDKGNHAAGSSAAASYRKGWQLAQRLLDQVMPQQNNSEHYRRKGDQAVDAERLLSNVILVC